MNIDGLCEKSKHFMIIMNEQWSIFKSELFKTKKLILLVCFVYNFKLKVLIFDRICINQ